MPEQKTIVDRYLELVEEISEKTKDNQKHRMNVDTYTLAHILLKIEAIERTKPNDNNSNPRHS